MRHSCSPEAFSVSDGSPTTPRDRGGRSGRSELGEECGLIPEPAARAPRIQPALALAGPGARSSPARRALSPAGGRGRARTVPALRARPLPAAHRAAACTRPNWGGGGGESSPSPPPRLHSGLGLPGCPGLQVPERPGAGEWGARVVGPPLGCAPSSPPSGGSLLSAERGPHPHPTGSRKAKSSRDGASLGALR